MGPSRRQVKKKSNQTCPMLSLNGQSLELFNRDLSPFAYFFRTTRMRNTLSVPFFVITIKDQS